ncbi:AbfB domain-containing protein [Plantactinospora sp. S1510]|uniref:AbfB domain-containing protein n=1 Tax=Plantactinospora alkalitolerans TaxID=2789879 RepID=A0ABS0H620_9ACTN|nr:AbfB domain-containing protein [Plantactinospora alkalitolerans]MBF9133925.1 AbfB domain-containing protein [Plantactinospora alkalitolerans]
MSVVAEAVRRHGSVDRFPFSALLASAVALLAVVTLAAVFLPSGPEPAGLDGGPGQTFPDLWPPPAIGEPSISPSPQPSAAASASPATAVGTKAGARPPATRIPAHPKPVRPTRADPSPTVLSPGARLGLEPVDRPGLRVRHARFVGRVDRIGAGSRALDRADSTFVVRTGLADRRCVSFESVNFPGYYLRHQDFRIHLHRRNGSALFAADSTFCATPGLAGRGLSLRSYNFPERLLSHGRSELFIRTPRGDAGRASATFVIKPPL